MTDLAPNCPIPETHDKFNEAHYFLERMMNEYHNPQQFRWNLNAFLQALRSVTFYLQAEQAGSPDFKKWYSTQQAMMREDELLRTFLEGRNVVVHERSLVLTSRAEIGVFRLEYDGSHKHRMSIGMSVPAELPSSYILREMAPKLKFLDEEHSSIGEEYGVVRYWASGELGEEEILTLCDRAWARIGRVVADGHSLLCASYEAPNEEAHRPENCNLMTETDLDPSLMDKWGW